MSAKMQTVNFLLRYSEIALKGKNRIFFEKKLAESLRGALPEGSRVRKGRGYFEASCLEGKEEETEKAMEEIPGLAWFARAEEVSWREKKELEEKALKLMEGEYGSFAVRARQGGKFLEGGSREMEVFLGELIARKLKKKVNLTVPERTLWVEVVDEKRAFLFIQKKAGVRGLPMGTGGKIVCLLSGGIDSPVAANLVQRRGVELILVHCHSYPITKKESINKVKKLAKVLGRYQGKIKLYLVPIAAAQKEMYALVDQRYLILLYRRLMLKVAQEIGKREGALGIITGDSLGQVASQTLENLGVQEAAVEMPVYRPLIAMNKEEIIQKAKEIGTYEISILPHEDCCSLFVPRQPKTQAKLAQVEQEENKYNREEMLKKALDQKEEVEL